MSTKLYPPYIEGTIPAFSGTVITVPFSMNKAVSKNQVAGFALKIKTVQSNTFITTIINTDFERKELDYIFENGEVQFEIPTVDDKGNAREDIWRYFNIGQYYKVQLAYITTDGNIESPSYTTGYYSTVGVVKYTTAPVIEMSGLDFGKINTHNYHYIGHYSQYSNDKDNPKDTTEKLYSSRFRVFDSRGNLVEEREEILHDITEDTEIYESYEKWTLKRDLEVNTSYYIQFIATTTNKMTVYTPRYRIMQKKTIEPDLKADFIAMMNFDEGYVDLTLKGVINEFGLEEPETGTYVICRTSQEEDNVWNEIVRFKLEAEVPSRFLWRDFTVQQGINYTYSIQQYNNLGLYSDRILNKVYDEDGNLKTGPIFADFEDMFLFDGTRQLKVKYNPSVSGINKNIQESKMETIGSKYPFIFRNGSIDYKEFPISGLISYLMDEANLFLNEEEFKVENKTTNLIGENFSAERIFKLKVLEWLTDGQPKLLRSPGEGNYIVRLLNVSMSPNATVGRMLHTFNCTATEIADYTYESLSKYKLIDTNDPTITQTRWKTIPLAGHDEELRIWAEQAIARSITVNGLISNGTQCPDRLYNLIISTYKDKEGISRFHGEPMSNYIDPNTKEVLKGFRTKKYSIDLAGNIQTNDYGPLQAELLKIITFATGQINDRPITSIHFTDVLPGTKIQLGDNPETDTIIIGSTGTYKVEDCGEIKTVIIPEGQILQGTITYTYEAESENLFDTVQSIEIVDVPLKQFWGGWSKTYIDTSTEPYKTVTTRNVREAIEDCKTELIDINKIHVRKRRLQPLYVQSNWRPLLNTFQMYYDMDCREEFKKEDADPYTVYELYLGRGNYQYKNIEGEKYYVDANGHIFTPNTGYLWDPRTGIKMEKAKYSPIFYYNDSEVSLYKTEEFIIENVDPRDFKSLVLDNGVFAEISYQVRITNYSFEYPDTKYQNVYTARQAYDDAVTDFQSFKRGMDGINLSGLSQTDFDNYSRQENQLINAVQLYYTNLIQELDETITQYKEANAIL